LIRAFLDANVLIDIELRRPVQLRPIKLAAIEGRLLALISFRVLEEVTTVLDRDDNLRTLRENAGLTADDVRREVLTYTRFAGGFDFARKVLRRDPRDEPILAAALAGGADVLVTENVSDFGEGPRTLRVATSAEFIDQLSELNQDS